MFETDAKKGLRKKY